MAAPTTVAMDYNITNRIEMKPETLPTSGMCDPLAMVKHHIRVKNLARQLGLWRHYEADISATQPASHNDMYRRWLIESYACPHVRMILAEATNPRECWLTIIQDVLMGICVEDILTDWFHTLKWDESANIVSFTCEYHSLVRELGERGRPVGRDRLRPRLNGRGD